MADAAAAFIAPDAEDGSMNDLASDRVFVVVVVVVVLFIADETTDTVEVGFPVVPALKARNDPFAIAFGVVAEDCTLRWGLESRCRSFG